MRSNLFKSNHKKLSSIAGSGGPNKEQIQIIFELFIDCHICHPP